MDKINLGMVGLGYWGPNLLRNFTQLDGCRVKTCCDLDEDALKRLKTQYPDIETTNDYLSLINDTEIQAIILAVSAVKHYDLAKLAIQNNKHVFVGQALW